MENSLESEDKENVLLGIKVKDPGSFFSPISPATTPRTPMSVKNGPTQTATPRTPLSSINGPTQTSRSSSKSLRRARYSSVTPVSTPLNQTHRNKHIMKSTEKLGELLNITRNAEKPGVGTPSRAVPLNALVYKKVTHIMDDLRQDHEKQLGEKNAYIKQLQEQLQAASSSVTDAAQAVEDEVILRNAARYYVENIITSSVARLTLESNPEPDIHNTSVGTSPFPSPSGSKCQDCGHRMSGSNWLSDNRNESVESPGSVFLKNRSVDSVGTSPICIYATQRHTSTETMVTPLKHRDMQVMTERLQTHTVSTSPIVVLGSRNEHQRRLQELEVRHHELQVTFTQAQKRIKELEALLATFNNVKEMFPLVKESQIEVQNMLSSGFDKMNQLLVQYETRRSSSDDIEKEEESKLQRENSEQDKIIAELQNINKGYKAEISSRDRQLMTLRGHIRKCDAKAADDKTKLKQFGEMLDRKSDDTEKLITEANVQVKDLRKLTSTQEEKLTSLSTKVKEMEKQNTTQQEKLLEAGAKIKDQGRVISTQQDRIAELARAEQKHSQGILQRKCQKIEEDLKISRTKLKTATQELHQERQQAQISQKKLNTELNNLRKSSTDEANRLRREVEDLHKTATTTSDKLTRKFDEQLKTEKVEKQKLEKENEKLKKSLKEETDRLGVSLKHHEELKQSSSEEISKLSEDVVTLTATSAETMERLQRAESSLEDLRPELATTQETLQLKETELSELQETHTTETEKRVQEIVNLQRTIDSREHDLDVACGERDNMAKLVGHQRTVIDSMKKEISRINIVQEQMMKSSKETQDFLDEERTMLTDDLARKESRLVEANTNISKLQSENTSLQENLTVVNNKCEEVIKDLDETKAKAHYLLLHQTTEITESIDASHTILQHLNSFHQDMLSNLQTDSKVTEIQKPEKRQKKTSRKSFISSILSSVKNPVGELNTVSEDNESPVGVKPPIGEGGGAFVKVQRESSDSDAAICEAGDSEKAGKDIERLDSLLAGMDTVVTDVVGTFARLHTHLQEKLTQTHKQIRILEEQAEVDKDLALHHENSLRTQLKDLNEETKQSLTSQERLHAELEHAHTQIELKDKELKEAQAMILERTQRMETLAEQFRGVKRHEKDVEKLVSTVREKDTELTVLRKTLDSNLLEIGHKYGLVAAKGVKELVQLRKQTSLLQDENSRLQDGKDAMYQKCARRMEVYKTNWEKAEQEVLRLDDLVERIRKALNHHLSAVERCSKLQVLLTELGIHKADGTGAIHKRRSCNL